MEEKNNQVWTIMENWGAYTNTSLQQLKETYIVTHISQIANETREIMECTLDLNNEKIQQFTREANDILRRGGNNRNDNLSYNRNHNLSSLKINSSRKLIDCVNPSLDPF